MSHVLKTGDVARWHYTKKELGKLNHGNNGGTTYWCVSNIGVFDGKYLVDTYWGSGRMRFSKDQINSILIVDFIENEANLISRSESERAYYKDCDCFDFNHPNSTSGNFFIRKEAKKCTKKMIRLERRNIKKLQNDINYAKSNLSKRLDDLSKMNIDSYIHMEQDVPLYDTSYLDDDETGQPTLTPN